MPCAFKPCRLVLWNRLLQPLKAYLHYHNAYGHLTWQDSDLPWGDPIQKVTRPFDHVIFRNHVTNWIHYISTIRVPVATKFDMIVTYYDGFLPIKSHYTLIKWSCEIMWQTKTIISLLSQWLWQRNLPDWLLWVTSSHEVAWLLGHVILQDYL